MFLGDSTKKSTYIINENFNHTVKNLHGAACKNILPEMTIFGADTGLSFLWLWSKEHKNTTLALNKDSHPLDPPKL